MKSKTSPGKVSIIDLDKISSDRLQNLRRQAMARNSVTCSTNQTKTSSSMASQPSTKCTRQQHQHQGSGRLRLGKRPPATMFDVPNPEWVDEMGLEGWTTKHSLRNSGKMPRHVDKYYFSPEKRRFRSRQEVERYLRDLQGNRRKVRKGVAKSLLNGSADGEQAFDGEADTRTTRAAIDLFAELRDTHERYCEVGYLECGG